MGNSTFLRTAAAAVAMVAAFGQASAATVLVNAPVDLRYAKTAGPFDVWAGPYFAAGSASSAILPFAPVNIEVGDNFVVTMRFLPNQSISLGTLGSVSAYLEADQSSPALATTNFSMTLDLLNSMGQAISTSSSRSEETYNGEIGGLILASEFSASGPMEVFGVRFSGQIGSFTGASLGYTQASFAIGGEQIVVQASGTSGPPVSPSPVPEPDSALLAALGLGLLAASRRRA